MVQYGRLTRTISGMRILLRSCRQPVKPAPVSLSKLLHRAFLRMHVGRAQVSQGHNVQLGMWGTCPELNLPECG